MLGLIWQLRAQRIAWPIRKPRNNADECPARKPEGTGLSRQLRGRSAVAPLARGAYHGRRVASRISSRKATVAATRGLFRGSLTPRPAIPRAPPSPRYQYARAKTIATGPARGRFAFPSP